jgi:hypothetical protein
MQAVVADPAIADAAKDHVVVRGVRCAPATPRCEARLASSCEGINAVAARSQASHHRWLKLHAQQ